MLIADADDNPDQDDADGVCLELGSGGVCVYAEVEVALPTNELEPPTPSFDEA